MGRIRYPGGRGIGSLDFTANPADTETVTIGTKVYTFKTVPALAADVLIGAAAADTAANLVAKVNALNTAPPEGISAEQDPADTSVVVVFANAPGTRGNAALVSTAANVVVSAAAMTNGEEPNFQTLSGVVYVATTNDDNADSIRIHTALKSVRIMSAEWWRADELVEGITDTVEVDGTDPSVVTVTNAGAAHFVAGDELRLILLEAI